MLNLVCIKSSVWQSNLTEDFLLICTKVIDRTSLYQEQCVSVCDRSNFTEDFLCVRVWQAQLHLGFSVWQGVTGATSLRISVCQGVTEATSPRISVCQGVTGATSLRIFCVSGCDRSNFTEDFLLICTQICYWLPHLRNNRPYLQYIA